MSGAVTQKRAEVLANGTTKIERYGWEVNDQPGHFEWVDKRLLNVDRATENKEDGYQRDLTDHRVLAICKDWSWAACGCLLVARRADGSLWIFDGQHRFYAAEKRADITTLPCLIFDVVQKSEEALAFLHTNTGRRPMRAIEKFRAMIISGDESAIGAERLAKQCGFEVGKGHGKFIECVACLINCFKDNQAILETVLLVCQEVSEDGPNERMIGGLFYLEKYLVKNKLGSISARHNVDALKVAGAVKIMQSIGEACAFYAKGGPKVFAEGIVRLLNYKRSSRRIPSMFNADD